MKYQKRRRKEPEFLDPDFAAALCDGESHSRSADRQAERKTRQFCRQVQRALNFALADLDAGEGMSGLFVEEVSPAPDCGRLLVHIFIPAGRSAAEAMSALRRDTARLRSEVAMSITRKRAPELWFVPACGEGGEYE